MEKKPLNNDQISRPGYPTLSEVKSVSKGKTIAKVAAVTAVVGTMSLTTACGDMFNGFFGKGEIMGDVMTQVPTTEDTSEVLMGEEMIIDPSDETTEVTSQSSSEETSELVLDGEIESYVETTTEEYELLGDDTVCVDTSDFNLGGDGTDETVLDGDVIIITTETT